jgi:hypothetical protein
MKKVNAKNEIICKVIKNNIFNSHPYLGAWNGQDVGLLRHLVDIWPNVDPGQRVDHVRHQFDGAQLHDAEIMRAALLARQKQPKILHVQIDQGKSVVVQAVADGLRT